MNTFISRKNVSESYVKLPRVTSTHDRFIYDNLVELADLIDFNHPAFKNRSMRNRSLGSVQTVLVEMALQNEEIVSKLKEYMVLQGKDWIPSKHYYSTRY